MVLLSSVGLALDFFPCLLSSFSSCESLESESCCKVVAILALACPKKNLWCNLVVEFQKCAIFCRKAAVGSISSMKKLSYVFP